MSEQHQIIYGQSTINFSLNRRPRKTLEISVYPDMSVKVVAPLDATLGLIKQRVVRRASWIFKQICFFEKFHPKRPKRCYLSGETHLYLGKAYRLKVVADLRKSVALSRGIITVKTHSPDRPDITRHILERWYLECAKLILNERVHHCLKVFSNKEIFSPKKIIIRQLNNRWGSMTKAGNLVLNRELIKAPISSIDYVITHELCHKQHSDHSRSFYELLAKTMPNWEKRKMQLEHLVS